MENDVNIQKIKDIFNWLRDHQIKALIIAFIVLLAFTVYTFNLSRFLDNQETIVIGQNSFSPEAKAGLRVLVLDHNNQEPVNKAKVEVALSKKTGGNDMILFSGETGETGTADISFDVPAGAEKDDFIVIKTNSRVGSDEVREKINIARKFKILLSADKPLYQPGQTIHIRSLVFDASSLKAIGNEDVTIIVEDPKANKIYKKVIPTNDFGISSVDFILGPEINLGSYRISAEAGNFKAEKNVEVKKYVLPKFKVEVSTNKEFYLPKQKLAGSVNARYFFGKPVANSKITVSASSYEGKMKEFKKIEGRTDAEGLFAFEFDVPDYFVGLPLDKGKGMIVLEAQVIDSADQEWKATKDIPVARENLLIEVYAEGGSIKPELENIINIVASYPNGNPAEADVDVSALCGRSNDIKLLAPDGSDLKQVKTDIYGLGQFKMRPGMCNVQLTLKARDRSGNTAEAVRTFSPAGKYEYVLIRPDKYLSKVGDTLQMDILTSGTGKNIYLDVIKNSQTLLTRSVRTKDGKGSLTLDLTPEMAGTLELHAYKILSNSDISRDTRIIFVDQPSDLAIVASPDKTQYKPGESAKLSFKVSSGKDPAEAALGITVVDESVFSVADEQAGLEKIYFLLEKQILEAKLDVHGFTIDSLVNDKIKDEYRDRDSEKNIERSKQQVAGIILAQANPNASFGLSVNTNFEKQVKIEKEKLGNFVFLKDISLNLLLFLAALIFISVILEMKKNKLSGRVLKYSSAVFSLVLLILVLFPLDSWGRRALKGDPESNWVIYVLTFLLVKLSLVIQSFFGVLGAVLEFIDDAGGGMAIFGLFLSVFALVVGIMLFFLASIFKNKDESLKRIFFLSVFAFISLTTAVILFFGTTSSRDIEAKGINLFYVIVGALGLILLAWALEVMFLLVQKKYAIGLTALVSIIAFPFIILIIPSLMFVSLNSARMMVSDSIPAPQGRVTIESGDWETTGRRGGLSAMNVNANFSTTATFMNTTSSFAGLPGGIGGSKEMAPKKMDLDIASAQGGAAKQTRIREMFPETLYYNPFVATNEKGETEVDIPMADSITSWRVNSFASTKNGEFGNANIPVVVFQDFFIDLNLPVSLTDGDEISVPVAVYNYLSDKQEINLSLEKSDWFDLVDKEKKKVTLEKNGVGSVYFRIKVKKIGIHNLTVSANGGSMSDAIRKNIEVLPNGKKIEQSLSNVLKDRSSETVNFPAGTIGGTPKIFAKVYPRFISQIVEGMDSILSMPHGCFEQTSSATYPNVLALDYMEKTGKITPEIQMKAEGYINTGYQRLVSFEVAGGGFSLFGNAPASETLTAYGLMEFSDMSKVYEVDQALITRTAKWLASKQNAQGGWNSTESLSHEGIGQSSAGLKNSAYILWALVKSDYKGPEVGKGLSYLKSNLAGEKDVYTLSVIANLLIDSGDEAEAKNILDSLIKIRKDENDLSYWTSGSSTYMGGRGNQANIEATSYITMALVKANMDPAIAEKAMNWLIKQKNANGTWGSTKTTVAVMQTLIYAIDKRAQTEGIVKIRINNGEWKTIEITKDNSDVMKIVDLSFEIAGNENKIDLEYKGDSSVYYQITASYFIPWKNFLAARGEEAGVKISVDYDNTSLRVNDTINASINLTNDTQLGLNLIMADIGIPAGFVVNTDDLDYLVKKGQEDAKKGLSAVERYEIVGRQLILYINKINKGQAFSVSYRLTAKYPIRAKSLLSSAYEYYNPDRISIVEPVEIKVD